VPGSIDDVSIDLSRGEIVGLAGLVGSGRTETLRALAGLEPSSTGDLSVHGRLVRWPRRPRQSQRYGIALVPEDRKRQGLVQQLPAYANITLPDPWRAATAGVLLRTHERSVASAIAERVGFARGRLDAQTGTLSGGNQQKLVLAKWISRNMPILLVDEPTRGIDVGAKEEVFNTLHALADAGTSIILVSSELEEIVEHSDRILVLARRGVVAELDGATVTQAQILERIFEVEEDSR
jgi:ABC-type sugar transport system ATPase subunit